MHVFATVSDMRRIGLVLDLATGAVTEVPSRPEFRDAAVVGRAPTRPFGITWNEREVYVANNRQLLVFDHALAYLRTEATRLQVNTHQLAYRAPYVWAASPWTNSLIAAPVDGASAEPLEFDVFAQRLRPYTQAEGRKDDDRNHLNSLLWTPDRFFVAAHNLGAPSFILCFDAATFRLVSIQSDVGLATHGLAYHGGELFWISTKTGEIRSDRGYRLPLGRAGFARGFAFDGEHFVVAVSEDRTRAERAGGDAWVLVFAKDGGTLLADHHLRGCGSVNDLRLLDAADYAHGVAPLWPAQHTLFGEQLKREAGQGV
jgi:hypothetical protein